METIAGGHVVAKVDHRGEGLPDDDLAASQVFRIEVAKLYRDVRQR